MKKECSEIIPPQLVTFALLAFNQEQFIHEAVKGAMAQDYESLEIILSDDYSSDRTYSIMQEAVDLYTGAHIVRLNRNVTNLGLIGHVNKIFEMASGEIIIVAAGDDVSMPHRTKRVVDEFNKNEIKPLLVHSNAQLIDEDGRVTGKTLSLGHPRGKMSIVDIAISRSIYIGATGGWSKDLYKKYGPLMYKNAYEDLTLGFRAHLENRVKFIDESLVWYRRGLGISTKVIKSGSFKDLCAVRCAFLKMRIDVIRQRRDDSLSVPDLDHEIVEALDKVLLDYQARLMAYGVIKLIPRDLLIFPRSVIKSFLSEVKIEVFFFLNKLDPNDL